MKQLVPRPCFNFKFNLLELGLTNLVRFQTGCLESFESSALHIILIHLHTNNPKECYLSAIGRKQGYQFSQKTVAGPCEECQSDDISLVHAETPR